MATAPAQIVSKGRLSNELIIEILAQKYRQHLPAYRQCATLAGDHPQTRHSDPSGARLMMAAQLQARHCLLRR